MACQKHGRPTGSKDKNSWKIKGENNQIGIIDIYKKKDRHN